LISSELGPLLHVHMKFLIEHAWDFVFYKNKYIKKNTRSRHAESVQNYTILVDYVSFINPLNIVWLSASYHWNLLIFFLDISIQFCSLCSWLPKWRLYYLLCMGDFQHFYQLVYLLALTTYCTFLCSRVVRLLHLLYCLCS
jgi:hypothetical protein